MENVILTGGFTLNNHSVNKDISTFPGGEEHIWIHDDLSNKDVTIYSRLTSSKEIMRLFMAIEAVKSFKPKSISAVLPYIPYGRQDRRCNKGEAFSLKVFSSLLNAQELDNIFTIDPHSDVTPALIDNLVVFSNNNLVHSVIRMNNGLNKPYCLVCPDSGARKKFYELARNSSVLYADKIRESSTGKITGTIVHQLDKIPKTTDLFVVDDICDGGRTFVELGKKLRGGRNLYLIITHGIFSKPMDELETYYDEIYTTMSFPAPLSDKVTRCTSTYKHNDIIMKF